MKMISYASSFTLGFFLSLNTAAAFDNACLLKQHLEFQPPTKDAPQSFLADCPGWVIKTTDEVWNTKPHVNATLDRYFSPNFTSSGSFGTRYSGIDNLKAAVANTQRAFPDLKIHVSDAFCVGNDVDGYKTVMPDVLTGTNLGDSSYGPATGKHVTYSGIAVTYVQRNSITKEWQYVAEWILHDELSLVSQLGLEGKATHPHTHSHPNQHCSINLPSWGQANPAPNPGKSLDVHHAKVSTKALPLSKQVIKAMDNLISNQIDCFDWDSWSKAMEPFWTKDMVYDTNYVDAAAGPVLGNSTGMRAWFDREHIPWNVAFKNVKFSQLIFAGEEATATTTTYAYALFKNDLAGIKATGRPTTIRIFDFYRMDVTAKKIAYNWMLLDLVDVMHQSKPGHRVVPKPPLREGWVQAPRAMDGIPAPTSELLNHSKWGNIPKQTVRSVITQQFRQGKGLASCDDLFTQDLVWYGPAGFGVAYGCKSYVENFLHPLYTAFPTRDVIVDVLTCEGAYCGVHGQIVATQEGEFLGESPTNKTVTLRFGFHYRVEVGEDGQGRVADAYALLDLPLAFAGMGVDLYARYREG